MIWKTLYLAFAALTSISFSSWSVAMHPFHVCVGQMKWNLESEVWEVSIRLHPLDLENAMNAERSARISIEDPEFEKHAIDYIDKRFYMVNSPKTLGQQELMQQAQDELVAGVERSSCHWVGMERERGWLWIHMEMKPTKLASSTEETWMINRLLLDHVERQENSIAIDPASKTKYSLQFNKDTWAKLMK